MKRITYVLGILVLAIFFTTPLMATTYSNSGTYVGTFSPAPGGNPTLANINAIVAPPAFSFYSKVGLDDNGILQPYEGDFPLYITSDDGWYSGTWATDGQWAVSYYAVKAGRQFALYEESNPAISGTWSTVDLKVGNGEQPKLSHIAAVANPVSTPEPTTLLLLGFGLVGLAAGARRKFKK
jgi:hypothetical protein